MSYAVYTGQGMVSGDVYGDRFEADATLPMPFSAGEAREEIAAADHGAGEPVEPRVRVGRAGQRSTCRHWSSGARPRKTRPSCGLRRCSTRASSTPSTSAASVASEDQLRRPDAVPPGIEKYLQLPPSVTERDAATHRRGDHGSNRAVRQGAGDRGVAAGAAVRDKGPYTAIRPGLGRLHAVRRPDRLRRLAGDVDGRDAAHRRRSRPAS